MSNIIEKVKQNITQQDLFGIQSNILLALSGGRDSVALLFILKKLSISIRLAHLNYELRDAESAADEAFCKELAAQLDLPIHIKNYPLEIPLKNSSASLQMLAREIRYDYFYELLKEMDFDFIATAHHANDNFETSFFNFTKGKGLRSISGIPWKNGKIVRPLLNISREEIDQFVAEEGIPYREDSSNNSSKYQRNFIRHNVVPKLKDINPGLINSHIDLAKYLRQSQEFIDHSIEKIRKDCSRHLNQQIIYHLQDYLDRPNLSFLMFQLFHKYGLSKVQLTNLEKSLKGNQVGHIYKTKTHVLYIGRKHTLIVGKDEHLEPVQIKKVDQEVFFGKKKILISEQKYIPKNLKKNKGNTLYVSSKLSFPITIRTWGKGDRIQPLGLKGTKLLSDVFIDKKIGIYEKNTTPILVCETEIVCIGQHQLSAQYAVREQDASCFLITFDEAS